MNILVTGTSSGIGRALAERLLASGHRVWGVARAPQPELAAEHPERFRASRCDVAQWDAVAGVAGEVESAWGHLDGLVACAGLHGEIGRAVTADPARWEATVRANLLGAFHTVRAFHPLLVRGPRRAKIVCFSGGGATKARPRFSAYGVAKTGIVRLVETIAEEERGTQLDINAVAPGSINTRLTDEVAALGPEAAGEAEYWAALKQKESGGGSMARAVALVEWLLSPASDGISGRIISAPWDPWETLAARREELGRGDIYTLRRIVPEDRGANWPPG
ncbi:MAG: SDR family oxidoreductase [Opitutaceae bacterium]